MASVARSGSSLFRRPASAKLEAPVNATWDDGESDLYEGTLPSLSLRGLLVLAVVLALLGGVGFVIVTQVAGIQVGGTIAQSETLTPTRSKATDVPTVGAIVGTPPATNTKVATALLIQPTLSLPTVTQAPPTPTLTPTRGPCLQKVKQGDTVYGLAARCGHRDLSIVDVILQVNGLKDANQLQIGQTLEIPWPTPTGGPPAQGQAGNGSQGGSKGTADASTGNSGNSANAEPTLPAGVIWYTVKKGDTAVSIVYQYHMTVKILRDLNPEIQFLQCDFGMPGGGPACTLKPMLGEGQRLRVTGPTPVPTLSPTPNGSETATPSPTPTFNAPFSQSPSDNMQFESSEVPTLRWVASGELGPDEVYLITVRDRTASITHTATSRSQLSFQLPMEWQPTDGKRHLFEWSVAVARTDDSGTPTPTAFTTEIRTFTWISR